MKGLNLDERVILKVVTDRDLLTSLAKRGRREAEAAAEFLAAYIVLSQILFLRLLVSAGLRTRTGEVVTVPRRITTSALRQVIRKVWDVNYRPIYEIDVLDNWESNPQFRRRLVRSQRPKMGLGRYKNLAATPFPPLLPLELFQEPLEARRTRSISDCLAHGSSDLMGSELWNKCRMSANQVQLGWLAFCHPLLRQV